ncbi:MAG: MotA/TolQ/ExbB proton channel family protein [bacterium]|nr:MotA/TolQ/ExbB proton channel family protein [bacterium]
MFRWGKTILVASLMLVTAMGIWQLAGAETKTTDQEQNLQDTRLAQMTGTLASTEPTEEELQVSESVKAFIDKGKPIGHVIIGLLIIGVFFVVDQVRRQMLEKLKGGDVYKADLSAMDINAVNDLVKANAGSKVGRLLLDVGSVYRQSADMSLISSEADFYRQKEEHRFNTFEARMAFLADTAGGLGLLGTVWGIYRGFAAKSTSASNDDLLAAMGIALVTTFMGIVVSVILNWLSTEMGASFRGQIMLAMEKVEGYREMLIKDIGRAA